MHLYIGLVHYPVYNKNYKTIASAVTITDLHDLARLARTYDVSRFFVITPLEDQQALAERVKEHWTQGFGASYNQDRKEAFELLSVTSNLEDAVQAIKQEEEETPLLIATDARFQKGPALSFEKARKCIQDKKRVLLIFGTAWGLDQTLLKQVDFILEPITGRSDYNHLSVRTAAAIILDRITGDSSF
jgi:hypothetical protein